MISCMIWCVIFFFVCRMLLLFWRLFQIIRIPLMNLISYVILIWREMVWCGMHALSSFSTSHFAVWEKNNTYQATRRCPWLFQHIWAHQFDPEHRHATSECAHVIRHCQQPAFALPIHLPSGQCTGTSPPHPLLHRWQHPSNYSRQIQGQKIPSFSVCLYPEGLRERQQTLQGESLAMALRTKRTPDDVHWRGGGCQAGASERGKVQGGGDKETPQGGCRQRARSGMKPCHGNLISYDFTYDITYHDIKVSVVISLSIFDIMSCNMISWLNLWYHT